MNEEERGWLKPRLTHYLQSIDLPAESLLEKVLCTGSFHGSHSESLTRQGGLHTLAWLLMAQLLPLQDPCTVKVVSDNE